MARYSFLTTWGLDAPLDEVWEAIHATERWPDWWPGVKVAERLVDGAGDGVGSVHRYVWRSRLPYDIEFRMRTTRVEPPYLLEGDADGQLSRDRSLAALVGERHRSHVRVERRDDDPVDERDRPRRPARCSAGATTT